MQFHWLNFRNQRGGGEKIFLGKAFPLFPPNFFFNFQTKILESRGIMGPKKSRGSEWGIPDTFTTTCTTFVAERGGI